MKKYLILIVVLICSLSAFLGCNKNTKESADEQSNFESSSVLQDNSSDVTNNDNKGDGLSEFMQYYVSQVATKVSQYNGLITGNWTLPTNLIYPGNIANKATVTWTSSDANVFSDIGEFKKPTYDKEITLTATIYSYIGEATNPESFEIVTFKLLAKGAYSTPAKADIVNYLQKITNGEISGTSTIDGGEINYDLNLIRKISNQQVDSTSQNPYEVRLEWNINNNGEYQPISQIIRGTSVKTIDLVATITFNGIPLEGDGKVYFDNVTLTAITEDEIRGYVIGQIASKVENSFSTGDDLWDEDDKYGCEIKWISNNANIISIEQNVVTVNEQALNGAVCPVTVQVSYSTDSGSNTFNLEYVVTVHNIDNSSLGENNIDPSLYHALMKEMREFGHTTLTTAVLRDTKFVNLDLSKYSDWFEGGDGELHAPITNLKGLAYCENIRLLNISGLNITEGLSEISTLSYLEALIAKDCNIETLLDGGASVLENMVNLKLIDLSNNKLTDLNSVLSDDKTYAKLKEVYLNDNALTDVSRLENAPLLTTLVLSNNQLESEDISILNKFTHLTYLSLANNNITDITSLKNLTTLTELRLQNNAISDVASLEKLTNLTDLYLGDNNISTISGIEGLINLEVLYLNNNALTSIDAVKNMSKLRVVNISNNDVNNASALAGLIPTETYTGLEELYAENNAIKSFGFVKNLTGLKKLLLANNTGTGDEADSIYDDFVGLTNLTVLTLSGKKLNSLEFLKNQDGTFKALERLEIGNCNLPAYSNIDADAEGKVSEYLDNMALLSELNLSLKYLDISNNPLYEGISQFIFAKEPKSIDVLNRLSQLEVLYADNVTIGDKAESLTSMMAGLKYVSLENCGITDLSWLRTSTNYIFIDLANNPIEEFNYSYIYRSFELLEYLYLDTIVEGAVLSTNGLELNENKLKAVSLEGFVIINNQEEAIIRFDANGGKVDEVSRIVKQNDYYVKLPKAIKENCELIGWSTELIGGAMITDETQIVGSEITLYAQWIVVKDEVDCSTTHTPPGTLRRDVEITDGDKKYENVKFENVDIETLLKLRYTKAKLTITLDVQEIDEGYKLVWICKAGTKTRLPDQAYIRYSQGESLGDGWRRCTVEIVVDVEATFTNDGKIQLEYGAAGDWWDDAWRLGWTHYTIVFER